MAQKLLISYFFFELAWPLLTIFSNAYIWRQFSDVIAIVIYNIGFFVALPVGFFINGKLLKYYKPTQLYFVGMLLQVVVVGGVIFTPKLNLETLFIFGIFYGIFASLFWGNRNYMGVQATEDSERNYFSSLTTNLNIIAGLVVPFIAGWFIEYGEISGRYSTNFAYKAFFIIVIILVGVTYKVLSDIEFKKPIQNKLSSLKLTKTWQNFKFISLLWGIGGGMMFYIPNLITLKFLGNEGVLGTIQSVSTIITFFVLFLFGKYAKQKHRLITLVVGIIILLIGIITLYFGFTTFGVLIFMGSSIIGVALIRNIYGLMYMKTIEEEGTKGELDYSLVSNVELYLNAGRVFGTIVLIISINKYSTENALLLNLALIIVAQIIMIYFARKILYTK